MNAINHSPTAPSTATSQDWLCQLDGKSINAYTLSAFALTEVEEATSFIRFANHERAIKLSEKVFAAHEKLFHKLAQ